MKRSLLSSNAYLNSRQDTWIKQFINLEIFLINTVNFIFTRLIAEQEGKSLTVDISYLFRGEIGAGKFILINVKMFFFRCTNIIGYSYVHFTSPPFYVLTNIITKVRNRQSEVINFFNLSENVEKSNSMCHAYIPPISVIQDKVEMFSIHTLFKLSTCTDQSHIK